MNIDHIEQSIDQEKASITKCLDDLKAHVQKLNDLEQKLAYAEEQEAIDAETSERRMLFSSI